MLTKHQWGTSQIGQHLLGDDLTAGRRQVGAVGCADVDHLARRVGDVGRVGPGRVAEQGPAADVVDRRLGQGRLLLDDGVQVDISADSCGSCIGGMPTQIDLRPVPLPASS